MSDSSIDEAQLLQLLQDGLGLFIYDSIISFNLEWRAVWSRKITGATALYLALRYMTLLNVIINVTDMAVQSCEGGFISDLMNFGTLCGAYLAQAAFASIRVYAIDGRQWTKAAIVMMLGLVPVAINIATRASRAVAAWSSRGSLTAVLFRDGTVHFVLVVGLNATNVVVALLRGFIDISTTVELISTVVLCRFFLNLRHFSSPDLNDNTVSSNRSSFSSFAINIIGNMGEVLEDDPQAFDNDLDRELDELNHAVEIDTAVKLDESAEAPSDTDTAQTRAATMAVFMQMADAKGADGALDQRVIDIV
ncbi:predicted protein [Postia placenta Mad-698-R]|nr:predicted protein [Postia placenta Mad-698-R]